jgi:hypothetical protein
MTEGRSSKHVRRTRTPANDNQPRSQRRQAKVQIPSDLSITQAEIEVVSVLLGEWIGIAANDNEGREDDKTSGGLCAGLDDTTGGE